MNAYKALTRAPAPRTISCMATHTTAIFDMDGVLIDSGPIHMRAWMETLEDRGIPYKDDQFRQSFGMRDTEVIPHLMGIMGDEEIGQVLEHKSSIFQTLVRRDGKPVEGVDLFIDHLLEQGIKTAVASLATAQEITTVLETIGFADKLNVVITREHKMRDKPAPDIFLTAAYRLGVDVEHAAIFEDAISGVEAARSAGAGTVVAVTTSYSRGELSHADIVVDSFHEPILKDLF